MNTPIFISGQISGLDKDVYTKRFNDAEDLLKSKGHIIVYNPIRVCSHLNETINTWEDYMEACFAKLIRSKAIYMLNGWTKSRGARIEWSVATVLDIEIIYQNPDDLPF